MVPMERRKSQGQAKIRRTKTEVLMDMEPAYPHQLAPVYERTTFQPDHQANWIIRSTSEMCEREVMRREIVSILSLILTVTVVANASDEKNDPSKGGWGESSTNRVLKVEGFMKRTKIVQTNAAVVAKLSIAKDKMRVLRKPKDAQADAGKGPQTLDEAAEHLRRHVSMAYPPSACTEQDGVFYFSGGTSTEAVEDFSSGFAIKKGEADILTWDKTEKAKEER